MGCGTSSYPPKKDTRSESRVTVAAQQRAEAAYRRQRMAQERAELTAVWRADMEVERARMLKEMSGGGSRRPSYCKELEDLKEEDPDQVPGRMDEYFQDYSVRAKNARNSLPINGYPARYTAERRGSRDERAKSPQRKEKARANDENGNTERKLSFGEKIDLDFLRLIANRSAQASPSNVRIEEDGQEGVGLENGDNTLDLNVGVVDDKPLEKNDEGRSERSTKSDHVLITENADTNLISPALANDVTLTDNDDSPARFDHSMRTVNDDFEKTNHDLESTGKSSDVGEEEELKGSELVQDAVDNINSGDDNNTDEFYETKETDGQKGEEKEQEGEIVEKQEQQGLLKQEIGLLEEKEKEQQKEDEEHSGEMVTPDKEQIDKETSENIHNRLNEPEELKTLENGQDNLNTQNIDTEEVTSEIETGPQQNDEGLGSSDNV